MVVDTVNIHESLYQGMDVKQRYMPVSSALTGSP